MISLAFPPTGGGGVQRTGKFTKYLPRFGWRPYIWSASQVRSLPADPSLLAEMPPCAVHRTLPVYEWAHTTRVWGQALCDRLDPRSRVGKLAGAASWRAAATVRWLTNHIVPDEHLVWALRSYGAVCRWVRREAIDAIYSTHSPPSNHLLALLVHQATHRPWVADFRDPWTDAFNYHCSRRWQHRLNVGLERKILREADAVISVTPRITETLRGHVDGRHASKFRTIQNGVDLDDFAFLQGEPYPADRSDRNRRFRITFVGRCERHRFPPEVQQGLTLFRDRARAEGIPFCFRVAGIVSSEVTEWLDSFGPDARHLGYLRHGDAVREMAASDLLLLTIPRRADRDASIPATTGKLYEYLASRRPILLAAAPDSEAAPIVRGCDAGRVVPLEPQAIAEALLALARDWSRGDLGHGCDPAKLQPYTRETAARDLANVLDSLAPGVRRSASRKAGAAGQRTLPRS